MASTDLYNVPPGLQAPDPLSKSAAKKAARREKLAEIKLERRAREKAAKKEKRRRDREIAATTNDDASVTTNKKRRKIGTHERSGFGGRVVVDLGFDHLMTEKEITSLTSQLAHTYSCNRQAFFPFQLMFTSLEGRTLDRLEGINNAAYLRWRFTDWRKGGYELLWTSQEDMPKQDAALTLESPESSRAVVDKSTVVYLTADAEEELTELLPGETYIIGGICDHNRYKELCLTKAAESGIRAARLPIGSYIADLKTRKVLTVNQVFEILVCWVETRDWKEALYSVIPKRKFQVASEDPQTTIADESESEHVVTIAEGELNDGES